MSYATRLVVQITTDGAGAATAYSPIVTEYARRCVDKNADKEKARKRAYYEANRAKVLARASAWAKENPEKAARNKRAYLKRNAESLKARRAGWLQANSDYVREYLRAYNEQNAQSIKARKRTYQLARPDVHRSVSRNRRARQLMAPGRHTATDIKLINERQEYRCVYCGVDTSHDYHVDHIVPLARGGSNWPDNLQITCPPCNRKKHTLDHATFLSRMIPQRANLETGNELR